MKAKRRRRKGPRSWRLKDLENEGEVDSPVAAPLVEVSLVDVPTSVEDAVEVVEIASEPEGEPAVLALLSPPKPRRGRPPKYRPAAPVLALEVDWERDCCTCTFDEIQARWVAERRAAISRLKKVPWVELMTREHQFVYYLAERVWFANARAKGNPEFLYAPLHRDRYLRPITSYLLSDTDDDGILVLGPRDTYKSTLAAALAQAHILRMKHVFNVDARDVITHHKFPLASRSVRRVAAKFRHHPYMRRYWLEYCPTEKEKQFGTQFGFTLPNVEMTMDQGEDTLRALGATASDTGSHVDLRINDDLVTEEHITSKAVRDESKMRYEAAQFTRDTVGGKEVNFGTPYHVNDLWSTMIRSNVEGEARYRIMRIPAIGETCRTNVGGMPCGHSLEEHPEIHGVPLELAPCSKCACAAAEIYAHPYRLTKAFLEKKMQSELSRTGRVVLWHLQYQCQGKAESQVAADPTWLRMASQKEIPPEAWPVICVDPAWKGTANQGEGDSAAIQVWFLERRGGVIVRWLADGVISNELTSEDGMREIVRLMKQYGCEDVAPEMHGGYGFRTTLENYCTEKGVTVTVIDLKMKQTGKDQRITAWLRELQVGHVVLCNEAHPDLIDALTDQIRDYPQLDHDDAIDCAAYSCDPNIAEAWAPRRTNTRIANILASRRAPEAQRTRHCAF